MEATAVTLFYGSSWWPRYFCGKKYTSKLVGFLGKMGWE